MEARFRREAEAWRAREDKLLGKLREYPQLLVEFDRERASLVSELDAAQAGYEARLQELTAENIRVSRHSAALAESLRVVSVEREGLRAEVVDVAARRAVEAEAAADKAKLLEDKAHEQQRSVDRLASDNATLRARLAEMEALVTQHARSADTAGDRVLLDLQVARLTAKCEASDRYNESLSAQVAQERSRSLALEAEVERLKVSASAAHREAGEHGRVAQECDELRSAARKLGERYERERARAEQLSMDIHRKDKELALAAGDVRRAEELLELQRKRTREVEDENALLARDARTHQDKVDRLEGKVAQLKKAASGMRAELVKLSAECETLRHKVNLGRMGLDLVESLNMKDLQQLYVGNKNVAEGIRNLMEHMGRTKGGQGGSPSTKKEKDHKQHHHHRHRHHKGDHDQSSSSSSDRTYSDNDKQSQPQAAVAPVPEQPQQQLDNNQKPEIMPDTGDVVRDLRARLGL